jgi:hypothetical protein
MSSACHLWQLCINIYECIFICFFYGNCISHLVYKHRNMQHLNSSPAVHKVIVKGEFICRYSTDKSRFQSCNFTGRAALSVDFSSSLFSQLDKWMNHSTSQSVISHSATRRSRANSSRAMAVLFQKYQQLQDGFHFLCIQPPLFFFAITFNSSCFDVESTERSFFSIYLWYTLHFSFVKQSITYIVS